jgi:hypothetical protein
MNICDRSNELSLDQFIDNIIYNRYDSAYGRAFKYLLQFDINNVQCVVPIEMLINFAGMRPFDPSHTDQKLEELGLIYQTDYIKSENSEYLLSPDTFIEYLKRTDEGKCFVDDYYSFLQTTMHKYLKYQTDLNICDQSKCTCDIYPNYSRLSHQLYSIDDTMYKLHGKVNDLTITVSAYLGTSIIGIGGIIGLVAIYVLLTFLYWLSNNLGY